VLEKHQLARQTGEWEAHMLDSLSTEELQFVKAIEKYKAKTGKTFLSWTEVLKIFKDLGYKRMAPRKLQEAAKGG
jgi:hypothetical protein